MELQDFIKEVLEQIISGVTSAQESAVELGAKVNPRGGSIVEMRDINFDIAVSKGEGTQKGGVGVFLAPAGTTGPQNQSNVAGGSMSRIKFSVPVKLPVQPKARPRRRK